MENRAQGVPRIQLLRESGAAMPFLSIEPLLEDLGEIDLSGMAWIIVGGESGHGARPMKPEWVRRIRAQCRRSKAPFFFKQWGGVRKSAAGRSLDGRTYDEFPKSVNVIVPPKRDLRLSTIARVLIETPAAIGQLSIC